MTGRKLVRVAVDSPLPQLDRLFDYLVPQNLESQDLLGCRVQVSFGRSKTLKNALVVEYADQPESNAKLAEIQNLVSPLQVMRKGLYDLLRAVADRQAATLSDVLKLAIPNRSVKVEKAWLETNSRATENPTYADGKVSFVLAEPRQTAIEINGTNLRVSGWLAELIRLAALNLQQGKSSIIVVPDFRDRNRLRAALREVNLQEHIADFETDTVSSSRYAEYLKTHEQRPVIVIGSRTAIFAYPYALESLLIYDDADQSLIEQTSPYVSTRDVALIRQQQSGCELVFVSNSVSCEMQRLIELKYAAFQLPDFKRPKVLFTEADERIDSTAYQVIKRTLDAHGSVLVQVASPGISVSSYCKRCQQRANCKLCSGPLAMADNGKTQCRWCSALNYDFTCEHCGSTQLRSGRAGSTRTASEFGKVFVGTRIIEATAEKAHEKLKAQRCIVVSTPGVEPEIEGGYNAVVLLDAKVSLNRDSLRAREQSLRQWANAISLSATDSQTVLVGVTADLGTKFALWQLNALAAQDLAERRELGFPPAVRMASITGPKAMLDSFIENLSAAVFDVAKLSDHAYKFEILGPTPIEPKETFRVLIRYDYALGAALAKELRARNIAAAAFSQNRSEAARASRPVRIKMDEPEVI